MPQKKEAIQEKSSELDDTTYQKIIKLIEEGKIFLIPTEFKQAIVIFTQALDLLPRPKNQWAAALWLYVYLGDVYFHTANYLQAKEAFFDALNCPGGWTNPFVLLRLGETLFELKEIESAKEYLLRAYLLEGEDIFTNEDPKYLHFLRQNVTIQR